MTENLRRTVWFQLSWLLIACPFMLDSADAWQPATASGLSKREQVRHVQSFEKIWKTIRDTHWDPELVGETWTKHRDDLLPKIKAATSAEEARGVMQDLIGRLGQSHFSIISESSYEVIGGKSGGGGSNDIGLRLRLVEGELVVTEIRPGGPAEKAGVQLGWQVAKIRDRDGGELIERLREAAHGPQRVETLVGMVGKRMTSDSGNTKIDIEFIDGQGQTRELSIACAEPPGVMASLGNLPAIRVEDKIMTLAGDVGYYWFNAFLDPIRIMPNYRKAIRDKKHSGGVIIDLRDNYGGIAGMTMGMTGEFVRKPTKLGTMIMKGSNLDFFANPRPNPVDVPVAVIVDECSISSAEFLAGGLQDNKLARVFGQRTAGLALPSVVERLPNGDGFQYAIADYKSAGGEALEMKGVVPDQPIELRREDLLRGEDPVLKAALEWIKSGGNRG